MSADSERVLADYARDATPLLILPVEMTRQEQRLLFNQHLKALAGALASEVAENARLAKRVDGAQLVAFQMQQSAAAAQGAGKDGVSVSWVVEKAGRVLAALAEAEKP